MSGSGEIQLKFADAADAVNEGDAHGEVSEDDVGTNLTLFDFTFSSALLVFESQSSMMSLIILRRLPTRQCTASRSERFNCRLVRSFVLILSFSDFPNENLLLRSLCVFLG